LQACSTVYILVTSRELLGVDGERAIIVPSLSMPDRRRPPLSGQFSQFESIQLFVDRAANVIPGFSLTPENESAVAQICQRLDGIPLAIELAAARLRMLPVEQIASRLDDVFRLLTGGSRTALPRHQTLQALIDWSYDLLTEPEKALFRRLTVFARHWTLEACEAICSGDGVESGEVLELLGRLIEKSLALKRSTVVRGVIRYRLLDSIRQYALTKLIESGEADTIRRRHAEYYFTFAEAGAPRALNDYLQKNWLDNMELEIDNIRAALAWSISAMNNEAMEMRMDRKGGIRVSAWALNRLGWLARERGDTTTARALLEQSLSIYRELDDKLGISWTTMTLGEVLNMLGDLKNARTMLDEGLTLARQQNEGQAIGWALSHLGYNALLRNEFDEAEIFYKESGMVFESLGSHKAGLAWAYFGIGETALAQKDIASAIAHLKTAIKYFNGYKNRTGVAWCIESLACVMVLKDDHKLAAKLWGMADSLRETKGVRDAPTLQALHEDLKTESRTKLGEAEFKSLSAENQSITLEQAVNEAFAI
jgi:tetratricopeptide (TPR) repeat protein